MKKIYTLILTILFFATATLIAHGPEGHGGGPAIKAEKAKSLAIETLKLLIKQKKITDSWEKITPKEPTQKSLGHDMVWVVEFINKKVPDKTKSNLQIFITLQGQVFGADFKDEKS